MRNKIIRLYYRAKDLSVRRFWENIGRWFSYFNISRRIYDFDYSSIYNPQNEACNASRTKRAKNKTKREAQTKRSVPSVRFFITAATLPFFKKFSPDFAGVCGLTPARLRLSPAPLHYI